MTFNFVRHVASVRRAEARPTAHHGHFRARLSALDPHSPTHCRPPFRRNTTDPNMAGYLYSSCVFAIALCRNRLFRSSTLLGPGFDCAALRVSR